MSSFNQSTTNFDNLLLHSLMSKLQIRPPPPSNPRHPLLSQSFEDLLHDAATSDFRLSGDDEEGDSDYRSDERTELEKKESELEKEIVRVILSGKTESLKPNSGQAVSIGEHHICVGFQEETGSEYRVWEWHGHIMLFDEENGCMPEYIYGNYFERLPGKGIDAALKKAAARASTEDEKLEEEEVQEEKVGNMGLKELIDISDSGSNRIVHRNFNTRF
ncbi:hypothetical protein Dimus_007292 [Dionaea muscipula]